MREDCEGERGCKDAWYQTKATIAKEKRRRGGEMTCALILWWEEADGDPGEGRAWELLNCTVCSVV